MTNPTVSIIVAVYNVEQYLDCGVQQLLAQTYDSYEIILVDDGSTDNSGKICDKLADEYNNINTYHTNNQGSGSARNTGINHARGKYLWFFDVDDKVETNLIEKNVKLADKYNTELIVFGFRTHDIKYKISDCIKFNNKLIETNKSLKDSYINDILLVPHGNGFVWNKFYLRSFIVDNNFRFGDQRIQQDEVFNLQLYPKLTRVLLSNEVLYDYYIYDNGNTRSKYIADRYGIYEQVYNSFMSLYQTWDLEDKRMTDYVNQRLFGSIITAITENCFHIKSGYNKADRSREIKHILNSDSCKHCLKYIKKNGLTTSFETKLYLKTFLSQNVTNIYIIRYIYKQLRSIKHLIHD